MLYLAIFVLYPLSTMARSALVVPGDAATTAGNIAANEALFRWGMAGEAVVVLIEIVLAGALYVLLRPVSRGLSMAAALARAGEGVVMAAGNLVTSIMTLIMVGGAGYLTALSLEQRDALALAFQEADGQVVLVWGLFFGLHLVLLGRLVQRSGFLPRLIGWLLAVAGVGYLVQSFGVLVSPGASGRARPRRAGRRDPGRAGLRPLAPGPGRGRRRVEPARGSLARVPPVRAD